MFARSLTFLFCFAPLMTYGQTRPPFGPPGYDLPDRVTPENLHELNEMMDRGHCRTPNCKALTIAISEIETNSSQRKNPGTIWGDGPVPDIPYGAIKARAIDKQLRPFQAIWPAICRAVVEIGARDEFVKWPETYTWIAGAALDVARHLTRPGLDCLGLTLAEMPASKRLQSGLRTAWIYCLDERRGAAHCARLKPTDPEFLPYKPPPYPR